MTPLQIVFLIIAAITLGAAVMVVSARRMMHAALWLILTLLGVAIIFATLETGFFAVIQVVVYVGAIAMLIIFAIMLTRPELQEPGQVLNRSYWLAILLGLGAVGGIVGALAGWRAFSNMRMAIAPENIDNIAALGQAFVSPDAYVIPFEVASILLIGALIGAIYAASEQKK